MSEIRARITAGTVETADLKDLATRLQALSTGRVTYKADARRTGSKQFPVFRIRRNPPRRPPPPRPGRNRAAYKVAMPAWDSVCYTWDIVNVYVVNHPLTSAIAGACLGKIYDVIRKWARKRKRETSNAVRVSIYGPGGTPYRTIEVGRPKEARPTIIRIP